MKNKEEESIMDEETFTTKDGHVISLYGCMDSEMPQYTERRPIEGKPICKVVKLVYKLYVVNQTGILF